MHLFSPERMQVQCLHFFAWKGAAHVLSVAAADAFITVTVMEDATEKNATHAVSMQRCHAARDELRAEITQLSSLTCR